MDKNSKDSIWELKPMLSLAGPIVMTELGWMTMSLVDTMMVGRVSPEAIGAVSIGTAVFLATTIFGMGLLLGLDTLVSQAHGADKLKECQRWLFHGFYLSVLLSPLIMGILWGSLPFLYLWGFHPTVLELTVPYLKALSWGTFPLMLYVTFRRYLQGMGQVHSMMLVLVSANLINAFANWVLIFGKLHFPAMGVEGAGWATCISRLYLATALGILIFRNHHSKEFPLLSTSVKFNRTWLNRLVSLSLPAALQTSLEVGVFSAVTALAGKLTPVSIAAHQIVLNAASFIFMVPLGISSAGAVRVGQAIGRSDLRGAAHSGWLALFLGAGFMLTAALLFLSFPQPIMRLFTRDADVISTGVSLLLITAAFMSFDGIQVVATGILRGAAETRTPMVVNLIGHWLVGLPLGSFLCFQWQWGVRGLWVGLSASFIGIGIVLFVIWNHKAKTLSKLRKEH